MKFISRRSLRRGFTLVELLIVIVVIAVLAAITVVAYRSISQKAQVAATQADLSQVATKLGTYFVDNGTYPTLLSDIGIKDNGDVTYYYTYDNSASPANWCVMATYNQDMSSNQYVSSVVSKPTSGSCTVTNLAINPSVESSTSNWNYYVNSGMASIAIGLTGGKSGSKFARVTWSSASTSPGGGCYSRTGPGSINPGQVYTYSMYVRPSQSQMIRTQLEWYNSSGVRLSTVYGASPVSVPAGQWTQITLTTTPAPTGSDNITVDGYSGAGGANWQVGDTLDCDASMVTAGADLFNYADGNSVGWSWNGAVNGSSSSGPAL